MNVLETYVGKVGVQVHLKSANTVKELLVAPKDKDSICKKGVIYRYRCHQPGCTMEYKGETGRNFGEHTKSILGAHPPSSTIPKLQNTSSNCTTSP